MEDNNLSDSEDEDMYNGSEDETDLNEDDDNEVELENEQYVPKILKKKNYPETDIVLTNKENFISSDIREKYTEIFKTILKDDKAKQLEEAIYKYSVQTCKERNLIYSANTQYLEKIYFNKCRSLYSNLNKDSYIKNTKIMNKINQNKIKIEELPICLIKQFSLTLEKNYG